MDKPRNILCACLLLSATNCRRTPKLRLMNCTSDVADITVRATGLDLRQTLRAGEIAERPFRPQREEGFFVDIRTPHRDRRFEHFGYVTPSLPNEDIVVLPGLQPSFAEQLNRGCAEVIRDPYPTLGPEEAVPDYLRLHRDGGMPNRDRGSSGSK